MKERRGGTRPGAGRKPLPPSERLRNRIMIALADDEFEALERARGSETVSGFMRNLLIRHLAARRRKS
jgi:hypothetical protein